MDTFDDTLHHLSLSLSISAADEAVEAFIAELQASPENGAELAQALISRLQEGSSVSFIADGQYKFHMQNNRVWVLLLKALDSLYVCNLLRYCIYMYAHNWCSVR